VRKGEQKYQKQTNQKDKAKTVNIFFVVLQSSCFVVVVCFCFIKFESAGPLWTV
jgi:hypothetical protein